MEGTRVMRRRITSMLLTLALTAALLPAHSALAGPGDLDPSFDGDGVASFGDGYLSAVTVAPDGSLAAAGWWYHANVERLTASGAPDPGFNGGNPKEIVIPGYTSAASAVAIDGSRRVIAAGAAYDAQGAPHTFVARLTPSGALDASFGPGTPASGVILLDPPGSTQSGASALHVLADGRIVVGGYGWFGNQGFVAARLHPGGTPDNSFSGDGFAIAVVSGGADAMAVEPGGRVTLAGATSGPTSEAIVRFRSDGSPDADFGSPPAPHSGMSAWWGRPGSVFRGVAILPGGRILAGGDDTAAAAARIFPDGSIDPTYNASGARPGHFEYTGSRYPGAILDMAVDSAGRAYLVSSASRPGGGLLSDATVVMVGGDGRATRALGGDAAGLRAYPLPGFEQVRIEAAVLDPAGRLVLAGTVQPVTNQANRTSFVRLQPAAPAPAPPSGGGPGGGGPTGGGPAGGAATGGAAAGAGAIAAGGRPEVRVRRTTLRRALRKGLSVAVVTSGPGRISVRLLYKRRAIGARGATATRAGRTRLRVRISRAGARRLRGRRSAKLTLVTAFRPADGGPVRTTRSQVSLRRR